MSAYTPAPWVLEQDGDVYVRLALDNVLRCMDERSDVATSQDYANARLIAAAPDMLAALQMVEAIWSRDQTANIDPESPLAKVRAAIKKATGENA
jgi:hypothetical protein